MFTSLTILRLPGVMTSATDFRRLVADTPPEELPSLVGRLVEAEELARLRLRSGSGAPKGHVPTAEPEPLLLTFQEAADRLRCSASYVETLVRQGKLPHVRLPATDRAGRARDGRLVRLRADDLRAWAEGHKAGA